MAKYYGVERSEEYLAHYGVRGMKWGVRRAIASGNTKHLDRQWKKAQKKLAKLNDKADVDKQNKLAKKYAKISAISGSIGAAASGLHVGSRRLQKKNWRDFDNNIIELHNAVHPEPGYLQGARRMLSNKQIEDYVANEPYVRGLYEKRLKAHKALDSAKYVSGGIGAVGLATSAITGVKAGISKYRTTTGGHGAAVAKRNEFRQEMDKAFAGTKYATKPRHAKKRK